MRHFDKRLLILACASFFAGSNALEANAATGVEDNSILSGLKLKFNVSTVPNTGELNPYGVAFVSEFDDGGILHRGDVLVSNFNNSANQQGTGTTIVKISPDGKTSLFFQGSPGLGLTTALGTLRRGLVLAGNVPTADGTCGTIHFGSLLVIDKNGHLVQTISDPSLLDGPWNMTVQDQGSEVQVFVSNVLSGSVTRIDLGISESADHVSVNSMTQIASGYVHRCDPAALVVGPAGLAYDPIKDKLFVASTGDDEIFSIHHATKRNTDGGKGHLVYKDPTHLHGPLALTLAPNGHLITSNGDAINPDLGHPSELIEFTRLGKFVNQLSIDSVPGSAFGIAFGSNLKGKFRFAAVDDNTNKLQVYRVK